MLYELLFESEYPSSNVMDDVFRIGKCYRNCAWGAWILNGRTCKPAKWDLCWTNVHCALVDRRRGKIIDPTAELYPEIAQGENWKEYTVSALAYECFGRNERGLPICTLEEMRDLAGGPYERFLDAAAIAEVT